MQTKVFSTRELADVLGTKTWRVRRLYEDGTLPEPGRFAGKRVIPGTAIPAIVDELRKRGWIDTDQPLSLPHSESAGAAMTTAAAPPTFRVHGQLTPAAISALARLLIAHARREIEAEAAADRKLAERVAVAADVGQDQQHGGNRA